MAYFAIGMALHAGGLLRRRADAALDRWSGLGNRRWREHVCGCRRKSAIFQARQRLGIRAAATRCSRGSQRPVAAGRTRRARGSPAGDSCAHRRDLPRCGRHARQRRGASAGPGCEQGRARRRSRRRGWWRWPSAAPTPRSTPPRSAPTGTGEAALAAELAGPPRSPGMLLARRPRILRRIPLAVDGLCSHRAQISLWRVRMGTGAPAPRHVEDLARRILARRATPVGQTPDRHAEPMTGPRRRLHASTTATANPDHLPAVHHIARPHRGLRGRPRSGLQPAVGDRAGPRRAENPPARPRTVLRFLKSPDLVTQEIWGHLCCHYAIRTLMADAAQHSGHDPDRVSFVAALRIARQSVAPRGAFPPEDHSATANLWLTAAAPPDRPAQPSTTTTGRTPSHQTQDAQMARQTRPPRRLAPPPAPTRLPHPRA